MIITKNYLLESREREILRLSHKKTPSYDSFLAKSITINFIYLLNITFGHMPLIVSGNKVSNRIDTNWNFETKKRGASGFPDLPISVQI
jgi:hypothetical protein